MRSSAKAIDPTEADGHEACEDHAFDSVADSRDRRALRWAQRSRRPAAMDACAPSDSFTQNHPLCQFLTADVDATDALHESRRHCVGL